LTSISHFLIPYSAFQYLDNKAKAVSFEKSKVENLLNKITCYSKNLFLIV